MPDYVGHLLKFCTANVRSMPCWVPQGNASSYGTNRKLLATWAVQYNRLMMSL